jgi:hypothetical protein
MRQISRRNGKKNGYQLPEEDGHVRGKRLESDGLLAGEEAALGGRHGGEAEAEREAVQVLEKIWKKIVDYECSKMAKNRRLRMHKNDGLQFVSFQICLTSNVLRTGSQNWTKILIY